MATRFAHTVDYALKQTEEKSFGELSYDQQLTTGVK